MRTARWHQVEILVGVAGLLWLVLLVLLGPSAGLWPQVSIFAAVLLLVAQPVGLVRLVEHFCPVPSWLSWAVLGVAGLGVVALIVLPYPRTAVLPASAAVYFAAVQGYAAWTCFSESSKRAGVAKWRLWLGSVGAATAVILVIVEGVAWLFGARLAFWAEALLASVMVTANYLGYAPPRRLLGAWQRAEFVRFLRLTAEDAPAEREAVLTDHLLSVASRSVTADVTAVLLGRDEPTVVASSDPSWERVRVVPKAGLIGVGLGGLDPVVGAADELEKPLSQMTAGEVVAVVPIVRSWPRWGVLVIVERRASLLLQQELVALADLCRHAADVLEHASLLREARASQPGPRLAGASRG